MKKILLSLLALLPFALSAQIVYKDLVPDYFQNTTGDKSLDMNNDGTTDLVIGLVILDPQYDVWLIVKTMDSFAVCTDPTAFGFVRRFDVGASIDGGCQWKSGDNIGLAYLTSGSAEGPWPGSVDKYVGIRFKQAGGYQYGWMRLSMHSKVNNYTLKDYAYQATTGVGLQAGDKWSTGVQQAPDRLQPLIYKSGTTLHVTNVETGSTAELYDINGRLLRTATGEENKMTFSVTEEMKGLHIVLIKSAEGSKAYKTWL